MADSSCQRTFWNLLSKPFPKIQLTCAYLGADHGDMSKDFASEAVGVLSRNISTFSNGFDVARTALAISSLLDKAESSEAKRISDLTMTIVRSVMADTSDMDVLSDLASAVLAFADKIDPKLAEAVASTILKRMVDIRHTSDLMRIYRLGLFERPLVVVVKRLNGDGAREILDKLNKIADQNTFRNYGPNLDRIYPIIYEILDQKRSNEK